MNPQSESHEQSAEPLAGSDEGLRPVGKAGAVSAERAVPRRKIHLYWIAALLAAVVVLCGTGAAMAYTFWYQQPEKVVSDTFLNALTAGTTNFNGTLDSNSKSAKVKMDFDGAVADNLISAHSKSQVTSGALTMTVNGTVQTGANGTAYVKLANVKELATLFTQLLGGKANGNLTSLVNTVDDKWIKVTPRDVGNGNLAASAQGLQCASQAINVFQGDPAAKKEVTDLYSQHRFIVIKEPLGEQGGSLGYKLTVDPAQAKAFMTGLKETQVYGVLHACDSNLSIDENALASNGAGITEFEMWSSKLNHELTAVKVTSNAQDGSSTNTLVVKPTFNKPVTITTPTDTVTVGELRQDLQALVAPMSAPNTSATR